MSYDSDPDFWGFGTAPNVCLACYPAGKSPDPTIVTFSGIERGTLWVPGDPAPPNGSHILPAIAACAWQLVTGPFTISYNLTVPTSMQATIAGPITVFLQVIPFGCTTYWVNGNTNPTINKYILGFAIVKPPQVDTTSNVPDIMDDVGIPAEKDTFVSPRPMTGSETVYVFSRTRDKSNIHVRVATP